MIEGSNEANDGDEQQENTHSDHTANDVDAEDDAESFGPGCYPNQQQPH